MALSIAQWKDLICKELNGGASLAANIDVLWDQFSEFDNMPRIHYLQTKLAAIDWLLGHLDEAVAQPVEGDMASRLGERHGILLDLRRVVDLRLMNLMRRGGVPAMGTLAATHILPSANPWIDPDSVGYDLGRAAATIGAAWVRPPPQRP